MFYTPSAITCTIKKSYDMKKDIQEKFCTKQNVHIKYSGVHKNSLTRQK